MKRYVMLSALWLVTSGCLLTGSGTHARLNNVDRLIAHPQFNAARVAAPEFTRDALRTIADLELEIERK